MRRNNEESYHEVVNVTLQNSNRERVQWEMEVVIFNAKVRIESEARYNLLQSSTIFDMLHDMLQDMLHDMLHNYHIFHDTSRQSSTIFEMLWWGEQ